jgi:Trehalose receptor
MFVDEDSLNCRVSLTNICLSISRSFQRDLHAILMFAQCFGIMPVNVSTMRMSVPSFKMAYCLLVQVSIVIMVLTLIYYFISEHSFDYGKVVPVFFFLNNLIIAINFVQITRKLSELTESWRRVELEFSDEKPNRTTTKIVVVFMTAAFVEHFLSKVEDYLNLPEICVDRYPTKFEALSRSIMPIFFIVFPYTHFAGAYVIFTCFFSTVLWSFADVFLITICCVIYAKLKKFNRKIVEMRFRHVEEKFWQRARLNYVAIHEQVNATNRVVSLLLMIALLNDTYFVCNQVLGALR